MLSNHSNHWNCNLKGGSDVSPLLELPSISTWLSQLWKAYGSLCRLISLAVLNSIRLPQWVEVWGFTEMPFSYPGCIGLNLLQFPPGDMERNCSLWEEGQSWRKKSDSMAKPISFTITIVVITHPFSTGLPLFPPVSLATTHFCFLWHSPKLCFVNYTSRITQLTK